MRKCYRKVNGLITHFDIDDVQQLKPTTGAATEVLRAMLTLAKLDSVTNKHQVRSVFLSDVHSFFDKVV